MDKKVFFKIIKIKKIDKKALKMDKRVFLNF